MVYRVVDWLKDISPSCDPNIMYFSEQCNASTALLKT